ncbi:class I SAM-dependent methyltransferase [Haloferula rosea]|uniref:Class I SAM-dependent methyltransferase n=1 Tax=Haloferula rosea TaxID=490093 RepID=A0A934VEM7_9BACT|nr:class I SAM-dependent methyltransferase [Haloferula rosea]MBK1826186.1 class I SAM-dependent methyltransferase [Haloferula rosea]
MKKALIFPLAFALLIGLLVWHPWRGDGPPPESGLNLPKLGKAAPVPKPLVSTHPGYTEGDASVDGIGKFYLNREIARVMGHQGLQWLERDSRESEEAPSRAVAALDFAPDATVADIGAGSGYYTFRMASMVPEGRVVAVDIQPEMIAHIEARAEADGIGNVTTQLGSIEDVGLEPETIDAALMVDAYHEFSHPFEMMESIVEALRPGGRVILLEYRAEDPDVPIKPLHKMSEDQVIREMEVVGLKFVVNHDFLPWQHFLVFQKP